MMGKKYYMESIPAWVRRQLHTKLPLDNATIVFKVSSQLDFT